ncbi:histone acetyltransferase type B [Aaosphaeria arxii CBS 175.79]|uniref:Histone acetyltransferase type B catalytic subunit n=1 Tax=Aaosphaeria arxii CBS 175.79 TaxID=1450172 RepID=A0A6A5XT80_9PLEO|nr:histone acetyltransferase type B [Aaosphaeria arxii CBS 175.79]KAF2015454.1 histone acetyltransferase type B [Aaosphaeria arxii CBS 175.79]
MDLDEWIHEANECVHINLRRPSEKAERVFDESFNPEFTYPILGEEQKIIGYKAPRIALEFRANDMKPTLDVQFKQKIDLSTMLPDGAEQVDIEAAFDSFIPTPSSEPSEKDPESASWTPPGTLSQKFERHGKKYEIWKASLADPAALEIWRNMQILVLLYIEGASMLELDEDWTYERWTLYLLYEVTPLSDSSVSPYSLAGFSTTYRYWIFPTTGIKKALNSIPSPPASANEDTASTEPGKFPFAEQIDPLQEPARERISQFLILPPYQGQSLGSRLYTTIFGELVKLPNIYEIPVEDPSETFDKMRDYADIDYLRTVPSFSALAIASTLPAENLKKDSPVSRDQIFNNGGDINALRLETKIVKRQFNRMMELHLLSTIPSPHRTAARITRKEKASNENDRKFYFWRLAVKERIYQQHADALGQIEDPSERIEKIEGALESQLEEYIERLEGLEKRSNGDSSASGGPAPGLLKRRHKRVIEDEDDWEDEDDESVSSKRARV